MTNNTQERAAAVPQSGRPFWLRIALPMALTVVVVFGFLAASAFYSLPSNVISTRSPQDHVRLTFNILASEDYGFFTKSPESDALQVYAQSGDTINNITSTPQNRPENLFGLSRTQRAQGPELANLSEQKQTAWVKCDAITTPSQCLEDAFARKTSVAKNTSTVATVCGDVILADEVPVPWSFRNLVPYEQKVIETSHLYVSCTK